MNNRGAVFFFAAALIMGALSFPTETRALTDAQVTPDKRTDIAEERFSSSPRRGYDRLAQVSESYDRGADIYGPSIDPRLNLENYLKQGVPPSPMPEACRQTRAYNPSESAIVVQTLMYQALEKFSAMAATHHVDDPELRKAFHEYECYRERLSYLAGTAPDPGPYQQSR